MAILFGVKFGGRYRCYPELHNEKPAQLEVSWTVDDLGGPIVIFWQFYLSQINEDKVTTFGVGVLQWNLVKTLVRSKGTNRDP